jgi:hypothetical protein
MSGHIGNMKSQAWNTPAKLVEAVTEVFGGQIDLDPCDNEYSVTNARVSFKLPTDGLKEGWVCDSEGTPYQNIFCNPPYGIDKARGTSIADWIHRCSHYGHAGQEIMLLIPASTETGFWHEYIWGQADAICFIKGRVSHPLEGKKLAASTKGSAMIYWGPNYEKFNKVFGGLGKVVYLD